MIKIKSPSKIESTYVRYVMKAFFVSKFPHLLVIILVFLVVLGKIYADEIRLGLPRVAPMHALAAILFFSLVMPIVDFFSRKKYWLAPVSFDHNEIAIEAVVKIPVSKITEISTSKFNFLNILVGIESKRKTYKEYNIIAENSTQLGKLVELLTDRPHLKDQNAVRQKQKIWKALVNFAGALILLGASLIFMSVVTHRPPDFVGVAWASGVMFFVPLTVILCLSHFTKRILKSKVHFIKKETGSKS